MTLMHRITSKRSKRGRKTMKTRDMPRPDMKKSNSDDNLMHFCRGMDFIVLQASCFDSIFLESHVQEMNLLVEADQPGNHLDSYISRLNTILSQKAAGILQLQNRLAHFQKRLRENNVLHGYLTLPHLSQRFKQTGKTLHIISLSRLNV
ncbi:hypothetical protein YC2023_005809 [Brassica napus]